MAATTEDRLLGRWRRARRRGPDRHRHVRCRSIDRRRTRSKTSAGTSSTTCRRRCCARCSSSPSSPAARCRASPSSSTSAARDLFAELPEITRVAARTDAALRVHVPRRVRRRARAPVRAVRRPHPLQGDGTILDGIHLERQIAGSRCARARRHHRHLRVQHPPARDAGHRACSPPTARPSHRHAHELRIQVRAAPGRRPRRRHAVPAEPVLERRAAGAHRRRRAGPRVRPRAAGRRRVPRFATPRPSRRCWTATSARTRVTRSSRSAAPAASTARSSWRASSRPDCPRCRASRSG